MGSFGPGEIMLVVAAVVLLFGAKKLPEFARSLGKAKKEFKKGLDDDSDDEESTPKPKSASTE
jgi:sec-independent protein translocase protein TatA